MKLAWKQQTKPACCLVSPCLMWRATPAFHTTPTPAPRTSRETDRRLRRLPHTPFCRSAAMSAAALARQALRQVQHEAPQFARNFRTSAGQRGYHYVSKRGCMLCTSAHQQGAADGVPPSLASQSSRRLTMGQRPEPGGRPRRRPAAASC